MAWQNSWTNNSLIYQLRETLAMIILYFVHDHVLRISNFSVDFSGSKNIWSSHLRAHVAASQIGRCHLFNPRRFNCLLSTHFLSKKIRIQRKNVFPSAEETVSRWQLRFQIIRSQINIWNPIPWQENGFPPFESIWLNIRIMKRTYKKSSVATSKLPTLVIQVFPKYDLPSK